MKLNEFIQEFQELEPDERLETLVELANDLPSLSDERRSVPFPTSCRVQECQTPVHLWVDVRNNCLHLEADVPVKSPTVRGLVALLVLGLEGASIQEIERIPDDLLPILGLDEALGMTRRQGLRGVVARIKRAARSSHSGD